MFGAPRSAPEGHCADVWSSRIHPPVAILAMFGSPAPTRRGVLAMFEASAAALGLELGLESQPIAGAAWLDPTPFAKSTCADRARAVIGELCRLLRRRSRDAERKGERNDLATTGKNSCR